MAKEMVVAEVTEPSVQEKVYNLYIELKQAKKDKKDLMKAHNENIKRIEDEIKDVIEEVEEQVTAAQREPVAE